MFISIRRSVEMRQFPKQSTVRISLALFDDSSHVVSVAGGGRGGKTYKMFNIPLASIYLMRIQTAQFPPAIWVPL